MKNPGAVTEWGTSSGKITSIISAWSIFIPWQAVFYSCTDSRAHLACVRPAYTSADWYPARFSSALIHSAPQWPGGIPSGRRTARIRTGHDSGTVSPFVHSTLSPLLPAENLEIHDCAKKISQTTHTKTYKTAYIKNIYEGQSNFVCGSRTERQVKWLDIFI